MRISRTSLRRRALPALLPLLPALVAILLLSACAGDTADTADAGDSADTSDAGDAIVADGAEAVSFLGAPLYRPELPDDVRATYEQNLEAARRDLEAAPGDADALIWVGRRLAYLGYYREAIDTFSRGLELHPEDARMLRHRGHRHLTLREPERAEADLRRAAELVRGQEDQVEPDGLPNARGVPTSSLHFNIWYHLALAHYLQDELEEALLAWNEAKRAAHHPDGVVAASYWLNNTLRRLGLEERADALLGEISAEMDIIESGSYLDILLLWKNERSPEELVDGDAPEDPLTNVTTAYGLARWHDLQGRRAEAERIWTGIVEGDGPWAAFGYMAAEAELARSASEG